MKRIVSILAVCAALVAVTVAYALPHHHHDGGLCSVEFGQLPCDGRHDEGGPDEGGGCVAESEYTDPSDHRTAAECGRGACSEGGCTHGRYAPDPRDGGLHLCPTPRSFTSAAPLGAFHTEAFQGLCFAHYRSVDINSAGGLRAPPVVLC